MIKRKDEVLLFKGWRGLSYDLGMHLWQWEHLYDLRWITTKNWVWLFGIPTINNIKRSNKKGK